MKHLFWAVPVVLGLIVLGVCATAEAPLMLVFGWVLFLARTLPRIAPDWASVVVATGALVLAVVLVHAFGRAWSAGRPWKLRWSLSGVGLVVLLFAAGTAMVSVAHQVGWLVTSREPLLHPTPHGGVDFYHPVRGRMNLKFIGLAMHNHHDSDASRALPPGGTFAPDGSMMHSWETHLLPWLWYDSRAIDMKRPWNDPENQTSFQSVIGEFINPGMRSAPTRDAEGYGLSHYAANSHVLAANKAMKIADITDGTSNTLLVGEVNAGFQPWGHPVNWRDPARGINRSPHGFGGPRHSGGAQFVMADGSVQFIGEKVSQRVLEALATPNAGDEVDPAVLPPSH